MIDYFSSFFHSHKRSRDSLRLELCSTVGYIIKIQVICIWGNSSKMKDSVFRTFRNVFDFYIDSRCWQSSEKQPITWWVQQRVNSGHIQTRIPATNQNPPLDIYHTLVAGTCPYSVSFIRLHFIRSGSEKWGGWFASHIDLRSVYEIAPSAEACDKPTRPTWGYLPTLPGLVSTAEC